MPEKKRSIRISFQQQPETEVPLSAYTIDRSGKVLAALPVKGGKLEVPDLTAQGVSRVILGPSIPEGGARALPTLSMLQRMQALEVPLRRPIEQLLIPANLNPIWFLCYCSIRGKVVREVTSGGVTNEYPVCHARVHACEVDAWPWIILKLSDVAIRTIRADILDLVQAVRPLPRPGPILGATRTIHGERVQHAMVEQAPMRQETLPAATEAISDNAKLAFRAAAANLPTSLKAALASESTIQVRQALSSHFELIAPLVWYWPWFWYDCDEIGYDDTDDDGRFSLSLWYPCHGDRPDLYFWVEYFIGGAWTTVYHPPIRTSTHWNYACGTDVTIRITDERVPFCDPTPPLVGKKLIVTTIGNNENVAQIQRSAAGASRGLTAGGNPFGGQIEPHVDFGTGLSAANTSAAIPFYYRWSYRRFGSSGDFTQIATPVHRRYRVEVTATGNPEYRTFRLGPFTVGTTNNLFKIRPRNVVDADGPAEWVTLNMRDDTAGAFFLSQLLEGGHPDTAAGKYELLLELFNSGGALITDWGAAGIEGFIPDDSIAAPFPPVTITTVKVTGNPALAEFDYRPAAVSAGMVFVLHIENNPCAAEIYGISVAVRSRTSTAASTSTPVSVRWSSSCSRRSTRTTSPSSTSRLSRRLHPVDPASLMGTRVGSTGNGFVFTPATFKYEKNTIDVHTLLTYMPADPQGDCTKAAFAETLYVAAMATDGWGRLSSLDASGTPRAFALAPH